MLNKYIPLDYSDGIDDGVFDYSHYRKAVYRPNVQSADMTRTELIKYNAATYSADMEHGFKVGKKVTSDNYRGIRDIIIKYWDCFCAGGAVRTILDYEFAIDTGAPPSLLP